MAHDRQPEPGAAGVPAARLVDAVEALEDPVEVGDRDADALVGDHQLGERTLDPARGPARCRRPRCTSPRSRRGCRAPTTSCRRSPSTATPSGTVEHRDHRCERASDSGERSIDRSRHDVDDRAPGRGPAPHRARCGTAPSGRRSCGPRGGIRRPSARRRDGRPSRSSSSASASASTASAPTGVFSSCLMLATKSVRTASTRRRSVTSSTVATAEPSGSGSARDHDGDLRRPVELEGLARSTSPSSARRSAASTASSMSTPLCVPVIAVAGLVAVLDLAGATHHDDAEAQLVDDRGPRRGLLAPT